MARLIEAYADLVAGGRSPLARLTLSKPNCTLYGLSVLSEVPDTDHDIKTREFAYHFILLCICPCAK